MTNIKSIDFNEIEYSTLVNVARKQIKETLTELEVFALKFKLVAKQFALGEKEAFLANVISEKIENLKALIDSDDELCVKLWLDQKKHLMQLPAEEHMAKIEEQCMHNKSAEASIDNKMIVNYNDREIRKLLLVNTSDCFELLDKSLLGILRLQMKNVFLATDHFLKPCYENLSVEQLPVPLGYGYEKTDGISIKQYAHVGPKGISKKERKHLLKAFQVSDQQFLENWAAEPFININEIYSYKEAEKLQMVDEYINNLLEYIVRTKSINYCFGELSLEAAKDFSMNGYNPDNVEHAHLHNIFTHYMNTEDLDSLKSAKRSLRKFRI